LENEVVAEVPTEVYGPPLVVEREIVYDVAPDEAAQVTFAEVCPVELAATPVGAAGGVQVPPVGVTERQVDGAEAAASLPEGARPPGSSR
jgi:hypothetical protein